jgi:hypothetical protein
MRSASQSGRLHSLTYQSGIFLSVCGIGGLLSIWAMHSVFVLVNPEPWMGGMVLVIGLGLVLYSHSHPSRLGRKVFG